jgi:hypothetical protein
VSSVAPSDYRVSPALAVRLVGLALTLVGVLVFLTALAVALAGGGVVAIPVAAVAGVAVVGAAGWWVLRRARVVHVDDQGYRVRFVRGAGATTARWNDVADADTRVVADTACLVLRLRDGRTTTIPLEAVADPQELVRDCAQRLARAHRAG